MATSSKLALAIATIALGGCTAVDHGLGEALKYDMALQTVDPDPVYPPGGAQPGDSAEVGVGAVSRYYQGAVKQPTPSTTTSGVTGGSGVSTGPK